MCNSSRAGRDVPGQEGHRPRQEQRVATPDRQRELDLPRSHGACARAPSPRDQRDHRPARQPETSAGRRDARRPQAFSLEPPRLTAWTRQSDADLSSAVGSGPVTPRLWKNCRPRRPRLPAARPSPSASAPQSSRQNPVGRGGFGTDEAACACTRWVIFETHSSVQNSGKGRSGPALSLTSPLLQAWSRLRRGPPTPAGVSECALRQRISTRFRVWRSLAGQASKALPEKNHQNRLFWENQIHQIDESSAKQTV